MKAEARAEMNELIGPSESGVNGEPMARASEAEDMTLDGDVREVSVVMADLRGFTTFCERVSPGRMSKVLNEYLTTMIDVILSRGGFVQDSWATEFSASSVPLNPTPTMRGMRCYARSRCKPR